MDCGLQDRPSEIPKLYGKALEGYDIVYGVRAQRSWDTAAKRVPYMESEVTGAIYGNPQALAFGMRTFFLG